MKAVKRFGLGLAVIIVLLILWQYTSYTLGARWLPTFSDVAAKYWAYIAGPPLYEDVFPSLIRAAVGLIIGIVLGMLIGVPLGYAHRVDPWVRPILEFFRALPPVTLLPIAMVVIGINNSMRIGIIAFACIFPVLLNSIDGVRRIDKQFIATAHSCGIQGFKMLIRVSLPASLPQIFTGIRLSFGLALIMMVISELVASYNGLGALIFESQRRFDVVSTYAGVLLLGTIGVGLNILLLQMERHLLQWHRGWRASADG